MTTTTIGDLFPELRKAVSEGKQKKASNKTTRSGTAERLKTLYPEIESWSNVFAVKAWRMWLNSIGMELVEPEERDERFPQYLVGLIQKKMVEMGSWR